MIWPFNTIRKWRLDRERVLADIAASHLELVRLSAEYAALRAELAKIRRLRKTLDDAGKMI